MTEVIEKTRRPDDPLATLREPQDKPQGRWRIDMTFKGGGQSFKGAAFIDFGGADRIISQRVEMTISRIGVLSGGQMPVDVEGLVNGPDLTLDIYILDAPFRHNGFKATAQQTVNGSAYEGRYTIECVNPDTCDCDGMDGPFLMSRIEG